MLTKSQTIEIFGSVLKTQAALGLKSRQVVYMWKDERIPEAHYLRIRYELRPELFDTDGAYIGLNSHMSDVS